MTLHLIIAALVGIAANRLRGGVVPLPGGDTSARACWGLACGVIAWGPGQPWWFAPAVAIGAFIGCTAGMFGGLAMGHRGPKPAVSPWITMTAWGLARVALPAVLVWWIGGSWGLVVASGLLCAPLYDVVWYLPQWCFLPYAGRVDGTVSGNDPPAMSEVLHGAAMMIALYLATSGVSP